MFDFQLYSNYGTSTPIVARMLIQPIDILGLHAISQEPGERVKSHLFEISRHLLRCHEIEQRINESIKSGISTGIEIQQPSGARTLPAVPDLLSDCESFLQSAKLAIRDAAGILKPLCGIDADHRFHKLASTLKNKYGKEDLLFKSVQRWESWVKLIISMRNVVDHPDPQKGNVLLVQNFQLAQNGELIEPIWGIKKEETNLIGKSMLNVVESALVLAEELFLYGLNKHDVHLPYTLKTIPEAERDPVCPIRFKIEYFPQSKNT